jgi:restriction endonuclease Mrr
MHSTKENSGKMVTEYNNNVANLPDSSLLASEFINCFIKSITTSPPYLQQVVELASNGLTSYELAIETGGKESSKLRLKYQAGKQFRLDLHTDTDNAHLHISFNNPLKSRKQIIKIKKEVNDEFIKYYAKHPHKLYNISPRQYEIFVAELLKDMGYEVWLNNHTRDGGRDIIAVLKTPSNDNFVTIVECKKHSLDNPVPIEIVERFMYTIRDKDKANAGWIVTTSTFSSEAQKCQNNYKWQLSLKDNKDLATLCSNYGKWKRTREGGLWLPDNPLG